MEPVYIGITADATTERYELGRGYVDMVSEAGGVPIVLPCLPAAVSEYVSLCHGFILSGGDDPDPTEWGEVPHPEAKLIDPDRQAFELALIAAIRAMEAPALGVCLGMQLMGLAAGGELDQHLPDGLASAADHWGRTTHEVRGELGEGMVHSHHRQALTSAGTLRVVARAHDDIIEAIRDDGHAFYVGVQWHPERTTTSALGSDLIAGLVEAAAVRA